MKKIIIAIMLVFCATTVRAGNTNISTSQYYVDTNAATRQDAVPANNANSVMTYDSTSPDGIGTKAIYDTTATYETQTNALVTATTANAAIINGINSEFVCANPPKCNLWNLAGLYGRLPSGYTELEYIESTGTQWIDTGLQVKSDTLAEFEYQFTDTNSVNYVFGQIAGSGDGVMGYRSNNGIWWFQRNSEMVSFIDKLKHKVIFSSDGNIYRDNEIIGTRGNFGHPKGWTILMFAEHNDNSTIHPGKVKIYNFIFREGSSIVRNFIPARQDSTGTLGMYDTVTNTFFTNQGSGTFIAGPAISYIPQNQ